MASSSIQSKMLVSSVPILFLALHLFLLLHVVYSSPPGDPVRCGRNGCIITNSIGIFPDRATCKAAMAAYPASEAELIAVVANATKHDLKMKVATRYSHSIPKLACPGGDQGLIISTTQLTRVVRVDLAARTMTVEAGITLEQLIKAAAKVGLALPYTPYWWGLTIGGLLSTGAHGSSVWGKGSAVHEHVVGLRVVSPGKAQDGYVRVRALGASDEDLNAAKVSLGVLGVISQVTLQLEPLFKRAMTYKTMKDDDLADQATTFGNQHEFADMTWHPSQKKVVYRIDDRVASNVSGNGKNNFIGFRATPSAATIAIRISEELKEKLGNFSGKCIEGALLTTTLKTSAYGLTNNGLAFTGYPIIGYQDRLQSSGSCLDGIEDALITTCPWDPRINGLSFHQTTFSIPLPNVKPFIKDVQTLVSLAPQSLCGLDLYNGILMRYVKASTAYMGKQSDSLDFDMTYYRSKNPLTPRIYEDILEEVEQMGLFKYGGLPHWGKNRNLAFDGVAKKYAKVTKFIQVKENYDPMGLFSSEWTDQILGLQDGITIKKEGCALEGLCICSVDEHCAPSKGYFCRPGKVYKEARVCVRLN